MAKKIILKEGGLTNQPAAPTGYKYIGYDVVFSEKTGSTLTPIGGSGGGSSIYTSDGEMSGSRVISGTARSINWNGFLAWNQTSSARGSNININMIDPGREESTLSQNPATWEITQSDSIGLNLQEGVLRLSRGSLSYNGTFGDTTPYFNVGNNTVDLAWEGLIGATAFDARISLQSGLSELSVNNNDNGDNITLSLDEFDGVRITDSLTSKGLYYSADYSIMGASAHGDRWIPDSKWVLTEGGRKYTADVSISSVQILDMFNTPIQLLAAPGSNKYYVIREILLEYTFVTTGYTFGGGVNWLNQNGGTSDGINIDFDLFITSNKVTVISLGPSFENGVAYPVELNQPLVLFNDNQNPTGGDGTLRALITYEVKTFGA